MSAATPAEPPGERAPNRAHAPGVLYFEPGATLWPLCWAPLLALAGIGFDLLASARPHVLGWSLAGLALLGFTGLWIYARRRFLRVRLTPQELCQGGERLPVARIAAIEADSVSGYDQRAQQRMSIAPAGTTVLGGGYTVPRKYDELLLRLTDGTYLLAWARDVPRLAEALREVLPS